MDEKIFTIEEQYNHQNNKIYGVERPSPFLCCGLVRGGPIRG